MTVKEASQHLGKSEATLRRWIKNGKLKAELVEGKYHIPSTEDMWIADDHYVNNIQQEDISPTDGKLYSKELNYVEKLNSQMAKQAAMIEFLQKELTNKYRSQEEASKRYDTIVMHLSKTIESQELQIMNMRERRWWKHFIQQKTWWKRQSTKHSNN